MEESIGGDFQGKVRAEIKKKLDGITRVNLSWNSYDRTFEIKDLFSGPILDLLYKCDKVEAKFVLWKLSRSFVNISSFYHYSYEDEAFVDGYETALMESKLSEQDVYEIFFKIFSEDSDREAHRWRLILLLTLCRGTPFEVKIEKAFLDAVRPEDRSDVLSSLPKFFSYSDLAPTSYTPVEFVLCLFEAIRIQEWSSDSRADLSRCFFLPCFRYFQSEPKVMTLFFKHVFQPRNFFLMNFDHLIQALNFAKANGGFTEHQWNDLIYGIYKSAGQQAHAYAALRPLFSDFVLNRILAECRPQDDNFAFLVFYEGLKVENRLKLTSLSFDELDCLGNRLPEEWKAKAVARAAKRIDRTTTLTKPSDDFGYCLRFLEQVSPKDVPGFLSLPRIKNEAFRSPFNAMVYLDLLKKHGKEEEEGFLPYGG